mmetsp:Transcript_96736/g.278361  ORF Transcript_96736/g.278361 Transcript_96736/m.278361 type:complete len:227 (-) Transcript_96736:7-687(-)
MSAEGTKAGAAAVRRMLMAAGAAGSHAGASAERQLGTPWEGKSGEQSSGAGATHQSIISKSSAMPSKSWAPHSASKHIALCHRAALAAKASGVSNITTSASGDSPHWQPSKCAAQRCAASSHERLMVTQARGFRAMLKPTTTSSKSAAWCNTASTMVGVRSLPGRPWRRTSQTAGSGKDNPGGGAQAATGASRADTSFAAAAFVALLGRTIALCSVPSVGYKGPRA